MDCLLKKRCTNFLPQLKKDVNTIFLNTLTTDDKYSRNRENFQQPIQMQPSKKRKTFSKFFIAFLKSSSNFEHFEKEDQPHSLRISENIASESRGY